MKTKIILVIGLILSVIFSLSSCTIIQAAKNRVEFDKVKEKISQQTLIDNTDSVYSIFSGESQSKTDYGVPDNASVLFVYNNLYTIVCISGNGKIVIGLSDDQILLKLEYKTDETNKYQTDYYVVTAYSNDEFKTLINDIYSKKEKEFYSMLGTTSWNENCEYDKIADAFCTEGTLQNHPIYFAWYKNGKNTIVYDNSKQYQIISLYEREPDDVPGLKDTEDTEKEIVNKNHLHNLFVEYFPNINLFE